MTLLQAALLGIVQGLTEFLPVSSSGHLLLFRSWMGLPSEGSAAFIFDVLIQLGTWLAVVAYYRSDLLSIGRDMLAQLRGAQATPQARLGWLVLLATLPAVGAGWLMRNSSDQFSSLAMTGAFLIVNGLLLASAEWFSKSRRRTTADLTTKDALVIGFSQVLGLLPAVSRSASTLFGGMLRNLQRKEAARFAFLMAVPILPAAGVVALLQLEALPGAASLLLPLLVGFVASAIVGYAAIRWLIRYLSSHSFYPFAAYCTALGLIILLLQ